MMAISLARDRAMPGSIHHAEVTYLPRPQLYLVRLPLWPEKGDRVARVVIVSNRVPLPAERGPQAGGLAVALADCLRPGTLWFGWSGKRAHVTSAEPRLQV